MKKLENKTALITGAGRGIGRATAELFARNGANLVIIARTAEEIEQTSQNCQKFGTDILAKTVDLGDFSQIDSLFEDIADKFPSLDILINNAAIFDSGLIADYPLERFQRVMNVNLIAPFYLAQKAIALMSPQNGGAIVNISSFSGCFGVPKFPGFGAYDISKYGLWGLTEILAIELADRGIRVNQVSPSGVDTKMFEEATPPGIPAEFKPADIAEKILYVVTDDSAPMTGRNIMMPEPY